MDPRDLLSHASTRYILVFFENTMASFNRKTSPSRIKWFDSLRESLNVNPLGYANSKMSGDYTEEIIFIEMKYLDPLVKSWILDVALEMIASEEDYDLTDVSITASRISKALNIPEKDFYDVITSQTAEFDDKITHQNKQLKAKQTIHYSKYKTTAIFYSSGNYVVEIFADDTFALTAPTGKKYDYEIINAVQERNDFLFFLKNPRSGSLGYFKIMPLGKAEFKFDIGTIVKLKI